MKTALAVLLCGALLSQRAVAQGEIRGWGSDVVVGQESLTDLVAVAAGWVHSLALTSEGTIVAWGDNSWGQCSVPAPNGGFVAIAAGNYAPHAGADAHSLGLKADGTIEAWGMNTRPVQRPAPNADSWPSRGAVITAWA